MTVLLASMAGLMAMAVGGMEDDETPEETSTDRDEAEVGGTVSNTGDPENSETDPTSSPTIEDIATGEEPADADTQAEDASPTPPGVDDIGVIAGGATNDDITGTLASDTVDGLGGDDRIEGLSGGDLLFCSDGDDTLLGNFGSDVVSGGDGNDLVKGGFGNDFLFGDDGDDKLVGSQGDDALTAGSGSDLLEGGTGDDLLYAIDTAGNAGEADRVFGEAGNDRLLGDDGDTLSGGTGVGRFEILVNGVGTDPVVITCFLTCSMKAVPNCAPIWCLFLIPMAICIRVMN